MSEWLAAPSLLVFIGAIISALGAFWTALKQTQTKRALRISLAVIFFGALISATGAMWSSMRQSQYEYELRSKSDEMLATVTGGDSFCYLYLGFPVAVKTRDVVSAILLAQGKYPLYDISIRIVNIEMLRLITKTYHSIPFEVRSKYETIYKAGNLGSEQTILEFLSWKLPNDREHQGYNVFITTRNGSILQMIRFRYVDGRWRLATKIIRGRGKNEVVLLEEVDPKFPRDERGQIQWDIYD